MDLVHVGELVLAYLLNPTSYGHETCTIGYSKDWGLKGYVEILSQPHQVWSYELLNSVMFLVWGPAAVRDYLINYIVPKKSSNSFNFLLRERVGEEVTISGGRVTHFTYWYLTLSF